MSSTSWIPLSILSPRLNAGVAARSRHWNVTYTQVILIWSMGRSLGAPACAAAARCTGWKLDLTISTLQRHWRHHLVCRSMDPGTGL